MYQDKKCFLFVLVFLMLILMLSGFVGQVQSQEKYPSRAVNIICAQTAGALDVATRVILPYVTKKLDVPVNVVNKPGGNSVPATLEVYNSRPDGYTLFADCSNFSSFLPLVAKDLPFKVMDRTFIATNIYAVGVIIVPSNSPYKSLEDAAADAKKDPGNFTWAGQGGIAAGDYMTRRFLKAINVDVFKTKPITTTGGSKAAALVAGNHIKICFTSVSSATPHLKAGTVRVLAGLWKEGDEVIQNVPSVEKLGYPTAFYPFWIGLSGPPKLPAYVVDVWNATLKEMEKDPEYLARLKNLGMRPMYLNSSQMKELALKDMKEAEEVYGVKK
jgi:tripartite-type tricarboxylate transporter receptor subunit TctC